MNTIIYNRYLKLKTSILNLPIYIYIIYIYLCIYISIPISIYIYLYLCIIYIYIYIYAWSRWFQSARMADWHFIPCAEPVRWELCSSTAKPRLRPWRWWWPWLENEQNGRYVDIFILSNSYYEPYWYTMFAALCVYIYIYDMYKYKYIYICQLYMYICMYVM